MLRRSFLASVLAAGVAPAYVGSQVLMPVKRLWTPPQSLFLPFDQPLTVCVGDDVHYQTVDPRVGGDLRLFSGAGVLLAEWSGIALGVEFVDGKEPVLRWNRPD